MQDDMNSWLNKISDVTGTEVQQAPSKAQTMPAKSSKKDESGSKKKGKFTMKKK